MIAWSQAWSMMDECSSHAYTLPCFQKAHTFYRTLSNGKHLIRSKQRLAQYLIQTDKYIDRYVVTLYDR